MQTQAPKTLQQEGSGDAKCHPWEPVEGCLAWDNVEAGVGSTDMDPPEYIATYRTQDKASREKNWIENTGRP